MLTDRDGYFYMAGWADYDDKDGWDVSLKENEQRLASEAPPADNWVSVNERLPETDKYDYAQSDEVLVFSDGEVNIGTYGIGSAEYEVTPSWNGYDYCDLGKVTHWMPLPSPPTGEDNGE